jgi:MoxR-like ATPase
MERHRPAAAHVRAVEPAVARSGDRSSVPHLSAAAELGSRAESGRELSIDEVTVLAERLRASVRGAVHLPAQTLDVVLATLLAGGHLLLEDHPGVGKTQLARALAGSVASRFSRVQATVDLLPSDIVGTNVWSQRTESFEFVAGPVFAHIVLVDELNRATPKTQSGLLEAMQEGQVTVDGESRSLPSPFMVIATQNPFAGSDGTFPLPLAQLDRFLARVSLGYPTADQEVALLSGSIDRPAPVSDPLELRAAQRAVAGLHASEALLTYVVRVLRATRTHATVHVGASPRAGLLLVAAARSHAATNGRDYVIPEDVKAMAPSVLTHRLQLVAGTPHDAGEEVVAEVLAQVPAS